jgi:hypothetical protein
MTFNMEEGVIRRVRSVFRKKPENAPEETAKSEWVSIRTMLMRVLGRFPEAKAAVVEGLTALCGLAVAGSEGGRDDPAWAT